ncbi:hypothetical protein [Actinokineospora sp. NPDC004072]
MNLTELLDRTRLHALDHLERDLTIPVIDGLQAQGDLIVIPTRLVPNLRWHYSRMVPAEGVELVRGVAGNNPHTLVADEGVCWIYSAHDSLRLAIAVIENSAPAYLVHPEHGGTGIAPGTWVIRRQQERGRGHRKLLVCD